MKVYDPIRYRNREPYALSYTGRQLAESVGILCAALLLNRGVRVIHGSGLIVRTMTGRILGKFLFFRAFSNLFPVRTAWTWNEKELRYTSNRKGWVGLQAWGDRIVSWGPWCYLLYGYIKERGILAAAGREVSGFSDFFFNRALPFSIALSIAAVSAGEMAKRRSWRLPSWLRIDNPYARLDVQQEATDQEIQAAYTAKAKATKLGEKRGSARVETQARVCQLEQAYSILSDYKKRTLYDLHDTWINPLDLTTIFTDIQDFTLNRGGSPLDLVRTYLPILLI